jgi:hypothetical protein
MRKKILFPGVAKVKREKREIELAIQVDLVKWLELRFPGVLFCASAGGMRTSMRQAVKMKRSGYRKGFPDLFIYEPRRGFNGLAIELKSEEGSPSKEQIAWITRLNARGYYATICKGLDEAMATVEAYFKPQTKTEQ